MSTVSAQSRITQLAALVATNTERIDTYLRENELVHPSFDASGPVDLGLPQELEMCRRQLLSAAEELQELMQGPRGTLFNFRHNDMLCPKFIMHFEVAKKVPLVGEISFEDLAADIGIDCSAATRILRLAITRRIFVEPKPGFIAHSAASKLLVTDSKMADWTKMNTDEMWPAAERTVDALKKWPSASEPNQTGFSLAYRTTQDFYTEMNKDPERARQFGSAMSCFTTGPAFAVSHLVNGYPWGNLSDAATVVDVGGSHGHVAYALAERFPNLNLVVQDLAPVIDSTPDQDKNKCVKFMVHDFFNQQPIKDADVYIYRWILHNWPDTYCVKMLKALIPALKKGSTILVMESVMPPPGTIPTALERSLRGLDIGMLEIANAKERSSDEWKALFTQADERLYLHQIIQPPGSNLSIIEVKWDCHPTIDI